MKFTAFVLALGLSLSTWVLASEVPAGSSHQAIAPLIDLGAEAKKEASSHSKSTSVAKPRLPKEGRHSVTVEESKVKHVEAAKVSVEQVENTHWGYAGKFGPSHWGAMNPKYSLCSTGRNQSPVDLRDSKAVGTNGLPELDVHYRISDMKIINNGHTIQLNYPLGSYIKVGDHRFELMQAHFHTPSEHKKEGFRYPMEMHLVHQDGDGNLAVIGILFQEGAKNDELQTILDHLPKDVGKEHIISGVQIDLAKFFPKHKRFYKYSGSLTTPPCSEGVYWMVFKQPIEASAEQIQTMNDLIGDNSRPVQPANARSILKSWADMPQENQIYGYY